MVSLRLSAALAAALMCAATTVPHRAAALELVPMAGRAKSFESKIGPVRKNPAVVLETHSVDSITRLFKGLGYHLEAVPMGGQVPRVLVSSFPKEMRAMKSIKARTRLYRKILLPLILVTNEAILRDRERLQMLKTKQEIGGAFTVQENGWLWSLAREYKVKNGDVNELLRRVDMIPPSLALAQSIEESGWGTSRYAQKGNAIFGQETYLDATDAMTGSYRGRKFKIKTFASLLEAVNSYARNLNTHHAYREMRAARAVMRAGGKTPDGHVLAGTLLRYSERGHAYIKTIRTVMDNFKLRPLDTAELAGGMTIHVVKPPRPIY